METSLHYNQKDKHLSFLVKEQLTVDPDIQLRFRGRLNTSTGVSEYHATLQKYIGSGPVIKESLTQPFRFGIGLGVSSSNNDEPFVAATATKKISLLESDTTQLSAKARVELDPRSQKMSRTAHVAISRRFLDFTAHQDLQLTVGLDLDWHRTAKTAAGSSRISKIKAAADVSLRENNWGVHYRRGQVFLTYDL